MRPRRQWLPLLCGPSTSPLDGDMYVTLASALAILAGLVIHKRTMYRPRSGRTAIRAFFVSFGLYFLPAAIVWAWLVYSVTHHIVFSDPWPSLVALVGLYLLADLLLRNEVSALRRPLSPSNNRWRGP